MYIIYVIHIIYIEYNIYFASKERRLDHDTCLVVRKSLVQPRVQKGVVEEE